MKFVAFVFITMFVSACAASGLQQTTLVKGDCKKGQATAGQFVNVHYRGKP
jgi:FKBP-type peptidyl-prolyl cis-trans isomerase